MSRPVTLEALLALALAFAGIGCGESGVPSESTPPRASADRPNVVLITLDTTRADALGSYGQILETSPNLDALAERGALFEQAASTHPETLPSHSTLFTGVWPYEHGVRSNAGYLLSERHATLAEILRDNGYATGAEVAAPVLRRETQVTQGFDSYRGAHSPGVELKVVHYTRGAVREDTKAMRVGRDITRSGIDFVRANQDRRFFLWLHYFDAHNPYSAPALFNRKVPQSAYHAEVASADFEVGRFLRELSQLGLEGRTLVVVTSDHGEGLHEHGEPSHSFFVYETTMRVPLVFAGPGVPEGKRFDSLVRTVDVAPTILDLVGLPPLEGATGTSLAPILRGETEDLDLLAYGEATRFASTFELPVLRYVRRGNWKYIHKVNPELYDLEQDPGELRNQIAAEPEIAARLRAELEGLLRDAKGPSDDALAALDAQTAAQLMALGYVAQSPAFAIGDEVASLELRGDDPTEKLADIRVISRASGLLARGEWSAAMPDLEGLWERNPDSAFVMSRTAKAFLGLERYEEAISLLERVRVKDPGNADAAYDLARAFEQDGRPAAALAVLGEVSEVNPCDERIRIDQHRILMDLARYEELMAMLEEGSARCEDMLIHRNNHAWALATLPIAELRDGARAVEIIEDVIRRTPEPNPGFLDTLAAAHAESGDFEAAMRAGDQVLNQLRASRASADVMAEVTGHLESYRAGRPVRDPKLATF